jgi:hypothetical protein
MVIAVVVIAVIGGFVLALHRLTGNTGPGTGGHGTQSQSSGSSTSAGAATAGPGGFAAWPPGLDGWTVVLATDSSEQGAISAAQQLSQAGVRGIGVLATGDHPSMRPRNAWEVFSRRYPNQASAQSAATALIKQGLPAALAVQVQRPGAP